MYLVYNTVVWLCQFLVVVGNCSLYENTFLQKKSYWVTFYDPLADVCFSYDLTLFYSASFYFVYFCCTAQIHKLKFKSEYYLRINIGNPAIPLWFPKKWLFGFFILKKQLASQNMFLVKSELFITTYLFLVFYRSATLQSWVFLKNIDNFLCK